MTFLYVFPHPDDESFGPGPAIARQTREGHSVHVLTLTKGGATKMRHELNLSVEEMGAIRAKEVACAVETLGAESTVLDFPDGELTGADPRDLERVIERKIQAVKPDVVVTYACHGNSLHPDHITAHAVTKRAFCQARDDLAAKGPRRLALFTLIKDELDHAASHLHGSPRDRIGAIVTFSDDDRQRAEKALACHETYQEVIREQRPLEAVREGVAFELYAEEHDAPLANLTGDLLDG